MIRPKYLSETIEGDLVLHTRVVSGSGGGPDKTILNSPRFLAADGYPMICAYMRDPGDELFSVLEARADEWRAPLLAVDDRGPLDRSPARQLGEICSRYRPAVWHGHDYKSNALGLWLKRSRSDVPMCLITTVHGWVKRTWKTPLYYAIDRYTLKRYDHVICVSDDLFAECQKLGIASDRLTHIPNAIDVEQYRREVPSERVKAALGIPPGRIMIGAIARLSAEKGFDILLRAVAALVADGLDVGCQIAGEGDAEETLRTLIDELHLGGRAELLGFQADPKGLYEGMDIFALSSYREGLPNVLLEAMAMEVPIVSTAVAGIPRLIMDGDNGLLVDAGSVESLADGLRRLVTEPALRAQLARAGRDTVEQKYSFAVRMERVRAVYDEAIARWRREA